MDNSFSTMSACDDDVEQVLTDFLNAWKRGNPVPLTQFFERLENEAPDVRESVQLLLVLQDQTLRWQMWSRQREMLGDTDASPGSPTEPNGRAPLLEDYVRHCSLDGGLESLPPEMVAHEFRLRIECGDFPTLENYQQRFPHLSPALPTLLTASLREMNSQLTATKGDAPTAVDPAMTQLEVPAGPLGTTLPMSPEEMPKRRRTDTERAADFGQYELLNEIARGAMGVVYRARHKTIGRIVALKMILAGQFASKRQVDQFLLEAQNAGQLKHDNIVTIYDAGKINEQYYIAMAYIEGHSLSDAVREKSMSAQRAAEIVEAVARALHFAHVQPQPVYHRDIKPANILMDHAGRPYVTDFGIAKRVEREESTSGGEDDVAGTPSYMPPEQTYGRDIGPWSDVYSTGALLYHLLTGRPPFLAESVLETIRQVRGSEPLPPRELNPKVDPDLEAVCLKCLEKDRTKRYLSAEQLADDLRRFLNHEPTSARPISQFARFNKWCHRNPAIAKMAATIVLLLASVAVTAVFVAREQASLRVDAEKARDAAKQERDQKEKARVAEEKAKVDALNAQADAEKARDQKELARVAEEKAKVDALNAKRDAVDARDLATKERDQKELARRNEEKAKLEADAARKQAETNLKKAIETVNVILIRSAESGLKDVPGMEEFRKRVAQDALEQLEPILKSTPNQREAVESRAKALVVQAMLFDLTGRSDQAEEVFDAAIQEFKRLDDAGADKTKHSLNLIAAYRQWGDSLTDRAKVDQSTAERAIEPEAENLLKLALEKYAAVLKIVGNETDAVDEPIAIELARTHQARSNTLIYLKQREAAVESLTTAINGLRRVVKQGGDGQLDSERRLGSCLRLLAAQDALLTPDPDQKRLGVWLDHMNQAKAIHKRLYDENRELTDIRVDFAITLYSRARVLADLAKSLKDDSLYVEASQELATAGDLFSELAADFRRTAAYEFHRIETIQLQAGILAVRRQSAAAALKLGEADQAIRAFNEKFPKAPQEDSRLRICRSTLELCIDMLPHPETTLRKSTATWLKEAFRDLRRTTDLKVAREASALESVAEHFFGVTLAEQRGQLGTWVTELKLVESALRDYGKAIPGSKDVSEYLRVKLCAIALSTANEFSKKGDQTVVPAILDWLPEVLKDLKDSKNAGVAANAVELLKIVSANSKPKL